MTQMLLFDLPTDRAETNILHLPASIAEEAGEAEGDKNATARLEHESGLHHMGDLARLVLLRYDLVAKRRATKAKRRAAK